MMEALLVLALLAQAETLEQRRDRVAARVEEIRGAKFAAPVALREGSRKEYASVALANARLVYGDDLGACERALKALGLIPPKLRLDLAITAQAVQGPPAYFAKDGIALLNPATGDDELVFRLTYALADQRHGLTEAARRLGPSFDAQMAFAAMRQGEADMAKQLLWAGKKLDEKHADDHLKRLAEAADKWERETSRFASMQVARLFVRGADFAYRRGGLFMETVRSRGGMAAVEKVYARPPASTEQILHPEKHLQDERPVTIDPKALDDELAAKGWTRAWSTTLGELGAAIVFETHLKEDTGAVAPGWGGDVLLFYENAAKPPLVVWATAWDTVEDAAEVHVAALKLCPILPCAPEAANLVLRRKTSLAVFLNVPMELKDAAEEALWKCTRRAGDRSQPFSE